MMNQRCDDLSYLSGLLDGLCVCLSVCVCVQTIAYEVHVHVCIGDIKPIIHDVNYS